MFFLIPWWISSKEMVDASESLSISSYFTISCDLGILALRRSPQTPLMRWGRKNQTFFILAINFRKKTIPKIKAEISTKLTLVKSDWNSYIVTSILTAKSKYFKAFNIYFPVGLASSILPFKPAIKTFSGSSSYTIWPVIVESWRIIAPSSSSSSLSLPAVLDTFCTTASLISFVSYYSSLV